MTERISAWASVSESLFLDLLDLGLDEISVGAKIDQAGTLHALDQHADRAVGQLQQLHRGGDHAEVVERVAVGIVLARIELRDQEQFLVVGHRRLERGDRFLAADEQRNDAVGEYDDVAKRQNGEGTSHSGYMGGWAHLRNKDRVHLLRAVAL